MAKKDKQYIVKVTATATQTKRYLMIATDQDQAERQALEMAQADTWDDFEVFSNASYELTGTSEPL